MKVGCFLTFILDGMSYPMEGWLGGLVRHGLPGVSPFSQVKNILKFSLIEYRSLFTSKLDRISAWPWG